MEDRGLKTRTPFSNAIDKEIMQKLKAYSAETMIPISKILDKAIEEYLKSTEK